MKWIEAALEVKGADMDELSLRLSELGVDGVIIEDESDFEGFLESGRGIWDSVDKELEEYYRGKSRVRFFVADDSEGAKILDGLCNEFGILEARRVDDSDWENNWREFYKPLEIGRRIIIVPEWEDIRPSGRDVVRLDPGLAFGTGAHATTCLSLEAIERSMPDPQIRVLDIGCGSGILGITALVLGASNVMACDIDPMAAVAAKRNAELNGFGEDVFRFFEGDILSDSRLWDCLGTGYRLIIANIVADVLIRLAPVLPRFADIGASVILSGVIAEREDEVRAAIEKAGFKIRRRTEREGWVCFTATVAEGQQLPV